MWRKRLQLILSVILLAGVSGMAGYLLRQPPLEGSLQNSNLNTVKTFTLAELLSQGIDIATESTVSSYQQVQACYSGFPILGTGSEKQMDPGDLRVMTEKHIDGFFLPAEFLDEIQKKFDAGWNLTTFCINGRNFTVPQIYFSMVHTGDEQIPARIKAPAYATKGAPAIIGYWSPGEGSDKYVSIAFSEPASVMGMGDITYFGRLELQSASTASGVSQKNIIGYTGGGDGPFGWSLKVSFDTKNPKLTVLQYCTYDSSAETPKNSCRSSIQ